MERHPLERFTVDVIDRSQLANAPYNPRVITDSAKRKLRKGLEKLGMVSPVTWNIRSGHLVGGHRRLEILDAISKSKDYSLTVAVVDLTPVEEREAVLLLNNPEAQGEWLLEELEGVLKTEGLDLEATGFDQADMFRLFGDGSPIHNTMSAAAAAEMGSRLSAARDVYASVVSKFQRGTDEDFYLVVVFKDYDDRLAFLEQLGLDDNRFQDGRALRQLLSADKNTSSGSQT